MRPGKRLVRFFGLVVLTAVTSFAQLPPGPFTLCPPGVKCYTLAPCGTDCMDQDNDALCDSWELAGGVDLNSDGVIDNEHDLPLPNADPSRPDIYLQYDWMIERGRGGHSHRPHPQSIRAVVDAFARQGFALHAVPGGQLRHQAVITFGPMDTACTGNDAVNVYDLKAQNFDPRRAIAYHYAVFGHYLTCDSLEHCARCPLETGHPAIFGASGRAEFRGDDFVVTTGAFFDFGLSPGIENEAGLLMHELGHNLGLQHAGNASFPEYKPNYLSVVNPNFTFTGIPIAATPGSTTPIPCHVTADCPTEAICGSFSHGCTRIDYSREALSDLNELFLDERLGIGAATPDITTYNCPDTTPVFGAASGPIDWNCNGSATDTNVVADINADGEFNYNYFGFLFPLTGHRDWGNLFFHFQCTSEGSANARAPHFSQNEPSIIEELRKRGRQKKASTF